MAEIVYYNDWGVLVTLFKGTAEECIEYYEKHIERCEALDAWIQ